MEENEITLSPKEISRSPGRPMKDNEHTYLLYAIFIFDNRYNLDTRLDEIRLSCFVMDLWSRFSVDSRPKWLKISENAYLGDK